MQKLYKKQREILKIIIHNPGVTARQISSSLDVSRVDDINRALHGKLTHLVMGDNDDGWYFNLDFMTDIFGEELSREIKELILDHTLIQQEVYDGFNS